MATLPTALGVNITIGPDGKLYSPKSKPPPAGTILNPGYSTSIVETNVYRSTVTVAGKPSDPPGMGKPIVAEGAVLPYIIGQQRIPAALVSWYGNLRSVEEVTRELTDSRVESLRTYETYFASDNFLTTDTITVTRNIVGWQADVVVLLCLGPDVELLAVYNDGEPVWTGNLGIGRHVAQWSDKSLLSQDMIWHSGQYDQAQDPYLRTWVNPDISSYPGIAYLILRGLNVTSSFPSLTFEVRRQVNPLGLPDGDNLISYESACGPAKDMNLATMAYEILTNDWTGVGISPEMIDLDSFKTSATQLALEGIAGAIYNQDSSSGAQLIGLIEFMARGMVFVNHRTGKVEFRLHRKPSDTSGAFILDPTNILSMTRLSKQSWDALPNSISVTYTSRCGDYSRGGTPIDLPTPDGTLKREGQVDYPLAMDYSIAQKCAIRDMPYFTTPSWEFSAEVTREAAELNPGDVVKFSWPEYQIEGSIASITGKTESKNTGEVTLTFYLLQEPYTSLYVNGEPTQFQAPDPSPKTPTRGKVVSAPFWLAYHGGFQYSYWSNIDRDIPLYLVEPENEYQRRFDVYQRGNVLAPTEWISMDTSRGYSSVGQLAEAINLTDGWVNGTIDEIKIEGVLYDFYLQSVGPEGAKTGQAMIVIDNEFFAFESVEKTGEGEWTLKQVHRSLFGSTFENHPVGSFVGIFSNDWRNIGVKTFSFDPVGPVELKALSWGMKKRENPPSSTGLTLSDWSPSDQLNHPMSPTMSRINDVRTLTPTIVTRGVPFDFQWNIRNRSSLSQISFFDDLSEAPEIDKSGNAMLHRIFLTDSEDSDKYIENALDGVNLVELTPDDSWALGPGWLWAVSVMNGQDSLNFDKIPITITA